MKNGPEGPLSRSGGIGRTDIAPLTKRFSPALSKDGACGRVKTTSTGVVFVVDRFSRFFARGEKNELFPAVSQSEASGRSSIADRLNICLGFSTQSHPHFHPSAPNHFHPAIELSDTRASTEGIIQTVSNAYESEQLQASNASVRRRSARSSYHSSRRCRCQSLMRPW